MIINVNKLHKELVTAGIEISGCSSGGKVWDLKNKEIQDLKAVKAIIAKHDPTEEVVETMEERLKKLEGKVTAIEMKELQK